MGIRNIYNVDLTQLGSFGDLIRQINDDMNSIEADITGLGNDNMGDRDRILVLELKVEKLESILGKVMLSMCGMAWSFKKSCDKCKGVESFIMRVQDLQREIHTEGDSDE